MSTIQRKKVAFDTDEYELAHGRAPRGRGSWAFYFEDTPEVPWWTPHSMTFGEARKQARAEAQRRGVTRVTVGS
jgi:hypothetical protein